MLLEALLCSRGDRLELGDDRVIAWRSRRRSRGAAFAPSARRGRCARVLLRSRSEQAAEAGGRAAAARSQSRPRGQAQRRESAAYRGFGRWPAAELAEALLSPAIEDDRLAVLARRVIEACRKRQIVIPSPQLLGRLCARLRQDAWRETHRRLTQGISAEQREGLDALTTRREGGNLSWLAWMRQMPEAAKPAAMLGLIERLTCSGRRGHRTSAPLSRSAQVPSAGG